MIKQLKYCPPPNKCFEISRELLDPPNNALLIWFVLCSANSCIGTDIGGILGCGYLKSHIGSKNVLLKDGL